jgi:hypothetical protein
MASTPIRFLRLALKKCLRTRTILQSTFIFGLTRFVLKQVPEALYETDGGVQEHQHSPQLFAELPWEGRMRL